MLGTMPIHVPGEKMRIVERTLRSADSKLPVVLNTSHPVVRRVVDRDPADADPHDDHRADAPLSSTGLDRRPVQLRRDVEISEIEGDWRCIEHDGQPFTFSGRIRAIKPARDRDAEQQRRGRGGRSGDDPPLLEIPQPRLLRNRTLLIGSVILVLALMLARDEWGMPHLQISPDRYFGIEGTKQRAVADDPAIVLLRPERSLFAHAGDGIAWVWHKVAED